MRKLFLGAILSFSTLAGLSNTASFTSDYVWRGQTQTNHGSAAQASLDYNHKSGLYAGVWVSTLSGNGSETDWSLGYAKKLGDLTLSIGGLFYHYVQNGNADTMEYNVGFEYKGYDLAVNYTYDHIASDVSSIYYSLNKTFLNNKKELGLNVTLGYTSHDDESKKGEKSHMDYKIGVVKNYSSSNVELWFTDTNRKTISGTTESEAEDKVFGATISLNL